MKAGKYFSRSIFWSVIVLGISLIIGCGESDTKTQVVNGGLAGIETARKPLIAVQLWSVREALKKDFEGTLKALADQGFDGVEFAGYFGTYVDRPADLKDFLTSIDLTASGAHVPFAQLDQAFPETVVFYQKLGIDTLIIPLDERAFDNGGVDALVDDLVLLSERMKPLGMKIGYHNHAQEWSEFGEKTYFEYIGDRTPASVILQQDVGWTLAAGQDPIAFTEGYPGRILTTHFKSPARERREHTPIIGLDGISWDAIYESAVEIGGAEWIVIEQEEYPDGLTPLESVARSKAGFDAAISN